MVHALVFSWANVVKSQAQTVGSRVKDSISIINFLVTIKDIEQVLIKELMSESH